MPSDSLHLFFCSIPWWVCWRSETHRKTATLHFTYFHLWHLIGITQSFRFGYGPDFLEALVVTGQDSFQVLLRVCLSKETKLEVSLIVMTLPTRSLLWFSCPLPQALITTSYVAPKRSIGPQNNSSLINVQKSDWDWNRCALLTHLSCSCAQNMKWWVVRWVRMLLRQQWWQKGTCNRL